MLSLLPPLITAGLLGTCPPPPSDPTELVPDNASAVLGVDVDGFARTPTGAALIPALRSDLQIAEILEVANECGITVDQTYAMVLARDPGDGRMLAVQARGLGEPATLECLATKLRARTDGAAPWVPAPAGCFTSFTLARDDGQFWVANSYTLIWARGSFVEPVAAKLEGAVALGLPVGLGPELARLDRSGHLWLAAKLDADDQSALPGTWAREAGSLTVAANLGEGLRAVVSLAAATPQALASTRDRLLASLVDLAERLDDYGIEHRFRERARVGIAEGVVVAEVELAGSELRQLRSAVGERVRGRGPL